LEIFQVDIVDGRRDRVAASGHPVLEPLQEDRPWGTRDVRIADPGGSYL